MLFRKFVGLCAGRIGQELNLTSLGNDIGINHATVREWISVLEASYIIFLLNPYYNNFGKRLIKAPKLYFADTGLACSILRIKSVEELTNHYQRGNLIESFLVADLLKQQYNLDIMPSLYFWRDRTSNEIDYIVEKSPYPIPIQIKAGKTVATDFFKGFDYWSKLTQSSDATPRFVIYGGNTNQNWPKASVVGWRSSGDLIKKILSS